MTFLGIYLVVGLVILVFMTILWAVSLKLKDTSIVDIFWGAGFVLSGWTVFALTPNGFLVRKILIITLLTIWGLRLSIHILRRNWGKGEDFRYQTWRQEEGQSWWWKSYIRVFLLQGCLMWVISIPLLGAQYGEHPDRLVVFDYAGIAIWLIGCYYEAVGDSQLTRFKANIQNKGKVLDTGVWRYTRHPNYFGDATQWWGYYLIACASGYFWTIFSPIIMTLFLLRVSGVTLLEKSLKETKPAYKEYIETTSSFIPWFPRKKD